jgi:hypothetical protein
VPLSFLSHLKEKCIGGTDIWTTNLPVELCNLDIVLDRLAKSTSLVG